ncbi:hypothetical protein DFH28DRAFT_879106 [Melampsora americana]|nr:hypothetical protein DFH28DRAFT_879106 [Melampsora americana]
MLALRPNHLILLVVLLSVVGLSLACETLKPLLLDAETKRFVDTLTAVQKDLDTLKALKNKTNGQDSVLGVAMNGYCKLVTLSYSRKQIIKIVGDPLAGLIKQYTDKPFQKLDKGFVDFQKKDLPAAIRDAAGFANDMTKLIKEIKQCKILQTILGYIISIIIFELTVA